MSAEHEVVGKRVSSCSVKCTGLLLGFLILLFSPSFSYAQLTTGTVDFTVEDLHDREQVTITLSDASTLVLLKDYVVDDEPGKYTWLGFVQNDANGRAYITVDAPIAVGTIHTSTKFYQLVLSEEPGDPVQEIDPSTFPPLAEPLKLAIFDSGFEAVPPELLAESPAAACDDTPATIDIMVLYSDDVAATHPNIELEITQAIERTRNIFEYSNIAPEATEGIQLDVNLVHTQMVQVNENPALGSRKLLEDFTDNILVTNAHELRNQHAADLVFLLLDSVSDACGIAWVLPVDKNNYQSKAFSVLRASCFNDNRYSFTHELGHLFGANHDKYAERNGKVIYLEGSNYGYSYLGPSSGSPQAGWRTVMAYDNECKDFAVAPCPVRNFFSSPDFEENGIPTGEIDSNNRNQLISAAPGIACFRDRPSLSVQKRSQANGNLTSAGLVESSGKNVIPPIACGTDCESTVNRSSTVQLTAKNTGSSRFIRWMEGGVCAGNTSPQCSFEMSGNLLAKAEFVSYDAIYPLSPRASFIRSNAGDPTLDPIIVDLSSLGIAPGQEIELSSFGFYVWSIGQADDARSTNVVFSSTNELLPYTEQNRIPGAIPTSMPGIFTSNTCFGTSLPTDISQDFAINVPERVTVPQGAQYLFAGTYDCSYADNSDPDGDLVVTIRKLAD